MGVSVANRPPMRAAAIKPLEVVAPPVGVVLWDDPRVLVGGWGSVAGDKAARVRTPEELPTTALWVSNADWRAFSERGCGSMHHMRPSNFLGRGDPRHIVMDLGLAERIDATNGFQLVPIIAGVADRVLRVAARAYPWDQEQPFLSRTLAADIGRALKPSHKHPSHLQSALASAYQEDSGITLGWMDDTMHVTLKRSRVEYAKRLLSLELPSDTWAYVAPEAMPPQPADRLALVIESERPVLAEVVLSFDNTPEDLARLVAFGILPFDQMPFRQWACQQEVLWLSRFVQVNVRSMHLATGYGPLAGSLRLPAILADDPLIELSYSAGLVAEAHMHALMEPGRERTGERSISLRSLWLRAYDRAEMFSYALLAHRAGLQVRAYGRGELMVRISRNEFPRLVAFALQHGFYLPVWHNLWMATGLEAESLHHEPVSVG